MVYSVEIYVGLFGRWVETGRYGEKFLAAAAYRQFCRAGVLARMTEVV